VSGQPPTLLSVRDLRVAIDTRAECLLPVQGVSLSVQRGEIVGVVGESGCGKSTLLRAIAGVLPRGTRVAGGSVSVNGVDLLPGRVSSDVAMVFQDPMTSLDPVMRVGDQVAEVPRRRDGLSRSAARDRAVELMTEVGIPAAESRLEFYPHQLSGGLRQRVLIAAALSGNPKLLLCDEPTTALDVTVQAQFVTLLRRLCAERDLGILYVTHDLPLVGMLCHRTNVMYAGQIVERGDTVSVLRTPRHPYTLALLQAAPRLGERVMRLASIPGRPPRLVGDLTGCRFFDRCGHSAAECAGLDAFAHGDASRETGCIRVDQIDWEKAVGRA
jgi:oligopeptide/dipeptide ABC transporter ATP-binding protein